MTEAVPLAPANVPTPLSINTLVAFVVVHESKEDPPVVIVAGVAVKLSTVIADVGAGSTVTLIVADPGNPPLSVTEAVMICVPTGSVADMDPPVPIEPPSDVQARAAAKVILSSSVSVTEPVKLIEVPSTKEAPSAGETIPSVGGEFTDGGGRSSMTVNVMLAAGPTVPPPLFPENGIAFTVLVPMASPGDGMGLMLAPAPVSPPNIYGGALSVRTDPPLRSNLTLCVAPSGLATTASMLQFLGLLLQSALMETVSPSASVRIGIFVSEL